MRISAGGRPARRRSYTYALRHHSSAAGFATTRFSLITRADGESSPSEGFETVQKLYELDKKNDNEVDFVDQKQKRTAREMSFAKFVEQCSESMRSKSKWHLKHLEKSFGSKIIAQICDDDITAYRDNRAKETIIRHGEPSRFE